MTAPAFHQGQLVYGLAGEIGTYVQHLGEHGHLVKPQMVDYEGDCFEGAPIIWQTAMADPPNSRIEERAAELAAQLSSMHEQITARRAELRLIDAEYSAAIDRIKAYPAVKRIDDFLGGKITHMVIRTWGGIQIKTLADALKGGNGDDRYDTSLKLLTLYGDSKGDLQWKVNQYRDGSGSSDNARPCCSEDEAIEVARLWAAGGIQEFELERKADPKRNPSSSMIESADKFGVPVPQWIREAEIEFRRKQAEKKLLDAEREVASARKALLEVNGGAA